MAVDQKNEKTRTQIILLLSYATLYTPNSPDVVWQMRPIQRDQSKKKNHSKYIIEYLVFNKQSTTQAHQNLEPPFFPISLWDVKIWKNTDLFSFLLRTRLCFQKSNILCRSGDISC
jgi:hypothetical protein